MSVEDFIKQFRLIMDRNKSRAQFAYLRSAINSEEEAIKFVDLFAEKTNTVWIPQIGKVVPVRYKFFVSWFCNRSWRRKDTSQGDDCNAKIDIYVKNPEPLSTRYDEYLHYDPPLPCVIEIAGQHSHPLESLDLKVIKGVRDQVKREFFKYFQMGLSVTEAKTKYAVRFRHKRMTRSKCSPTLRQAQRLYNQWKGVKRWPESNDDNPLESHFKPVTFKEILSAVPKREILYSVEHLRSEIDPHTKLEASANTKDIQFPLVFYSVGSAAALPNSSAPLLYKLKHGTFGELVTDVVRPRLYTICIDSASPVVVLQSQRNAPTEELPNSPEPVPDEILGIPMNVESPSTDPLNVPIKLEPLDDGYEDEPSQFSAQEVDDSSMMPIITQAFSCEDPAAEEIDVKPNICLGNSATELTAEKTSISPGNAGNSFFPLVFTLKGSIVNEGSNTRSLVYDLKQGLNGLKATEIVIPQISSVQINSLNEAAFQFKDASMLKAEGPLSITVQTEYSEDPNLSKPVFNRKFTQRADEKDIIPVIINASVSSCDFFPVIADSIITWSKKPQGGLIVSPVVAPSNIVMKKPEFQREKVCSVVETEQVTVPEVDKIDEDYLFLMSLLPDLKKLPPNEKNIVKSRMKDVFVASRFTTNRYQYEKKSTNIYRDCGVLPISGGWKF